MMAVLRFQLTFVLPFCQKYLLRTFAARSPENRLRRHKNIYAAVIRLWVLRLALIRLFLLERIHCRRIRQILPSQLPLCEIYSIVVISWLFIVTSSITQDLSG